MNETETPKVILGMDIGGTFIRMGLIDESINLTGFSFLKTANPDGSGATIDGIIEYIKKYCAENLNGKLPTAVSMGFPSTIDKERKVVLSTPNIPGIQNVPVVDIIEQVLGIPAFINRDVNFLFLYDIQRIQVEEKGVLLGFYIGTGFGNTISVDGKLLLGKNGVAAELGHIPVLGSQLICNCGNLGCIENYASGKYLAEMAAEHFPQTPIEQLFVAQAGHAKLDEFIDYLSIPIATEITLLDPECIILGGGIIHMDGFPRDKLEERLHVRVRKPYPANNMNIQYSHQTQENGVVGAGIYGFRRLAMPEYR